MCGSLSLRTRTRDYEAVPELDAFAELGSRDFTIRN
jgi:hypothetical protein